MEIIPAIDLLEGSCVRLNQGNYEKVTLFNHDPVAQAISWQDQGARRLHLVDLDGAKTGKPINDQSIQQITTALEIPIQVGGGVRSIERAEALLELGVDRVILGTVAIEQPELVNDLADRHPNKIVIGIDAKKGRVATRGWTKASEISAIDLARNYSNIDIAAIITTDIETDGTLQGPNLDAMKKMAIASHVPVIASGGVGKMSDLLSLLQLEQYGVTAVIVGRALYDGAFTLKEANQAIGDGRLQDSIKKDSFIA